MIGYKAFDQNFMCKGFQYEVGKTYEFNGNIKLCSVGFHFCENIADCFYYYPQNDARFAKVEALGGVIKSDVDSKCVTDKIRIIEEIPMNEAIQMSNSGNGNTGNSNIGNRNTGDKNTGKRNAGDRNSGDWNTGDNNAGNLNTGNWNSGESNTGNRNTGNGNVGFWNTGHSNTGDWNTGDWNSGNCNSGKSNTGDYNTGNYNVGDQNTGNLNIGSKNAGNQNIGSWNSGSGNVGDWNKSSLNNGCFMTVSPTIMMFNKPSTWTLGDWYRSSARSIMNECPVDYIDNSWVMVSAMTDEEKEEHPEYNDIGGYLKVTKHEADRQKWWDELSDSEKEEVMSIPNFDADIFYECTGIKVQVTNNLERGEQ